MEAPAVPESAAWRASVAHTCGGMGDHVAAFVERLRSLVLHFRAFDTVGLPRPAGILVTGPSGVGKTTLTACVASASGLPVLHISGTDVFKRDEGDSEAGISAVFARARDCAPSIVVIDSLESIAPSSADSGAIEWRLAAHVCAEIDGVARGGRSCPRPVCVVGISPDATLVHPRVRSPGRLDFHIAIGVPNASQREEMLARILAPVCERAPLLRPPPGAIRDIADRTHGYTPADLRRLVSDVISRRLSRDSSAGVGDAPLSAEEFEAVLDTGVPSALLAHAASRSSLRARLSDMAGIDEVVADLRVSVVFPLRSARAARAVGVHAPRGVLIHGPPGTGKTALAMALAAETGLGVAVLNGAEARSKVVGESERSLARFMAAARAAAPCVVVMDDVDALAPRRNALETSGEQAGDRLLSALLTEMDGIVTGAAESAEGVFFLATTSRMHAIDPAVLRPGRLEKHVELTAPDARARERMLLKFLSHMPASEAVLGAVSALTAATEGYTGADLRALCNEAGMCAIRARSDTLEQVHVDAARAAVPASFSDGSDDYSTDSEDNGGDESLAMGAVAGTAALSRQLRRARLDGGVRKRTGHARRSAGARAIRERVFVDDGASRTAASDFPVAH